MFVIRLARSVVDSYSSCSTKMILLLAAVVARLLGQLTIVAIRHARLDILHLDGRALNVESRSQHVVSFF